MNKYLLLFFYSLFFASLALAQYPIRSSTLSIQNIVREAPNALTFSIYFKNTASDSAINYSGGQFHLNFNKDILNSGTGTLVILNSGLPGNVQPTNPTVYTSSTPGQLRMAPKIPPGAAVGGFNVGPGDSVLVVKLRLSTSASSFLSWTSNNIAWRKAPDTNPVTKVSAYIWMSNQLVSPNTSFFIYPSQSKELTVTALIEGFYDGSSMVSDTVSVELRNTISPFNAIESSNVLLNSSGSGITNFYSAQEGINYYITIKHLNSLETWSANTPQFIGGTMSYDFTTAQGQAYGGSQKQKGTKWCLINGDTNQDQYIDGSDYLEIVNYWEAGDPRMPGDTNGDVFIDGSDYLQIVNNFEISSITPLTLKKYAKPIKQNENMNITPRSE